MSHHVDPPTTQQVARPARRGFVLLPALTFLVGLLLGAGLMWVSDDAAGPGPENGREDQPAPAAPAPDTAPPTTGSSSEAASACLEAAGMADQVLDLGREIAGALADLDAARMRTLLDRLETLEPQVRGSIRVCRGLADAVP